MNEHDRNNLKFLLNANKKAFKKWSQSVTWDDMNYAMEILGQYSKELDAEAEELRIEAELELMNGDYREAKDILAQVMR